MKLAAIALILTMTAAMPLKAGAVTTAEVYALADFIYSPTPCFLTSAGEPITCQSGPAGSIAEVTSTAFSTATEGTLDVVAVAGAVRGGAYFARAYAAYDFSLLLPGTPSGVIIGRYSVVLASGGIGGQLPGIDITQDAARALNPDASSSFDIVNLSSAFTAGEAVRLTGSAYARVGSPGSAFSSGRVQFQGFFDEAGNAYRLSQQSPSRARGGTLSEPNRKFLLPAK